MSDRDLHALTALALERALAHLDRLDRSARRRPWEVAAAFGLGIAMGVWWGAAMALVLLAH